MKAHTCVQISGFDFFFYISAIQESNKKKLQFPSGYIRHKSLIFKGSFIFTFLIYRIKVYHRILHVFTLV